MSKLLRSFLSITAVFLLQGIVADGQTANFTVSASSYCVGSTINFTDASSGATSYSWNTGVGTSTLQNASAIYTTAGTYAVTLQINGSSGPTHVENVTIFDKPTVSITGSPTAGCVPLNVAFNSTVTPNATGSLIYAWDFGDGNTSPLANPPHTYFSGGQYNVSVAVTNGAGCTTTLPPLNNYITAYALPIPSYTTNQSSFCLAPATVNFTSTSSGSGTLSSSWTFGDGGTGFLNTMSHTYNTGGNFNVILRVTDSHGCTDSLVTPAAIVVNNVTATFTSPATNCEDNLVNVANTTAGSGSTTWSFGDGNLGGGQTSANTYQNPGTYTITMTTTVNNCPYVVTHPITINAKPSVNFTWAPTVPCPPRDSLHFTSTGTGGSTYFWKWRGGTATGPAVDKIYPANPSKPNNYYNDTVKLIVTSTAGCTDSLEIDTVYLRDIVVEVLALPEEGCAPLPVNFQVNLLTHLPKPLSPFDPLPPYPATATSWTWDYGDATTGTGANPLHQFAVGGRTYNVKVVVTTSNGCKDSGYKVVTVDSPVHPSLTISQNTVCPRVPITFTNTTPFKPGTTYFWDLGDTSFTAGTSTVPIIYRYKKPGRYTVKLFSNHNGCQDTLVLRDTILVNPANAEFTQLASCAPSTSVQFTDASIGATSYLWLFGDGTTSALQSPNHTFPAMGTYYDTLTTYNSVFQCRDTFIKKVDLVMPILLFQANDTTICKGDIAHFVGGATSPYTLSFSYQFGTFNTPFNPSATVDYNFPDTGHYTVTLIAQGGANSTCVYTSQKLNYMLISKPYVNFIASPPIGCKPVSVLFTDTTVLVSGTSSVSRVWDFGDGNGLTGNVKKPTHLYPFVGNYTIKLVVTDDVGCQDSLTRLAYVQVRKPVAKFGISDDTACLHIPVQFRDSSTGATGLFYDWQFGDGSASSAKNPTHSYSIAGKYSVRLIVSDSTGCSDTVSHFIVATGPHASFTMDKALAVCPPLQIHFDGTQSTGGKITYSWDFGLGGGPATGSTPLATFNNSNKYIITLTVTDSNGCSDIASDSIKVLGYNGSFSYTPTDVCVGSPVFFNANTTGVPVYKWDFNDGTTLDTSSPLVSHIYTTAKSYTPVLVYSEGPTGCNSNPSQGLIPIRVDEITADFTWTVPCAGVPFTLTDRSNGLFTAAAVWNWDFGNGATTTGSPTTFTYPASGSHPVTLVVTNAIGCKDTITKSVFINPLPIVDAGDDEGICPGDSTIFVATGAQTYTWTPAAIIQCLSSNCDSIKVWTAAPTTYYVTGVDGNGCINKDSAKAYIQIKTEASLGTGGAICVGESFQLFAKGATSYKWTPAATLDNGNINNPKATPQITTTYILEAQKGTCLISFDTVTVVVHPLPLFDAGFDETINLGESIVLHASKKGIDHILWRRDTTLSCNDCFDPTARPYYSKKYYATGYDQYGCSASDSISVFVRCNGSLVFIPNTFSPNGDGQNDFFFPRGEGVGSMSLFRVYNRWGQMVFERSSIALNDEHAGWDGTYKGQALPPDVYMYTMQARCEDGKLVTWKGDITLVK